MKKPIILSILFVIISVTSSFGQGVWSDVVRNFGFKSGKLDVNGKVHQINFGANLEGANLEGAALETVTAFRGADFSLCTGLDDQIGALLSRSVEELDCWNPMTRSTTRASLESLINRQDA